LVTNKDFLTHKPNESLSVIESLDFPLLKDKKIKLDVKREDLVHTYLSGNKWRKLKYNIEHAKRLRKSTLLSFGGAYSNHIYATAAAGKLYGFETIGIIRGDELTADNETLNFAIQCGMKLKFVSRELYRKKTEPEFLLELENEFGDFYVIPEGGTNALAIQGCEEIVSEDDFQTYDVIAVMVGTGGTFSGILNASKGKSHILGISALKGEFMNTEIENLIVKFDLKGYQNYSILTNYHHGGYGKSSQELNDFIPEFTSHTQIPIEFVYTGKLFYALFDLIAKDYFKPQTNILAVHTGGLRADRRF